MFVKDPQPPTPWNEPLNCTVQGPAFWGRNIISRQFQGSFDSLHVNIFSNDINLDKSYPVMIYIHGGGFTGGDSGTELHGPDYIIEKEITLVTINYRLGAFGFLSLDDAALKVPGNAGFKDQRFALEWIQVQ